MVMLGVAEAGKFGFVFSSPARWFRRRPGELEGYKTVLVPAEPRSPPWSHQDEKSHAYYCRTTKNHKTVECAFFFACQILTTKLCPFLIPFLALGVPVKLQAS